MSKTLFPGLQHILLQVYNGINSYFDILYDFDLPLDKDSFHNIHHAWTMVLHGIHDEIHTAYMQVSCWMLPPLGFTRSAEMMHYVMRSIHIIL